MEGYNANANMYNYGNFDPQLYNHYQHQLNSGAFAIRPSSVNSYQTSATPSSVEDLSDQSQLERTFSSESQNISNDKTQMYETQWTQQFINPHLHGYYPQNTAAIAPYIGGYAPHWAALGNYMTENPWYRYNQTYLPVPQQQEKDTDSETTWPDNSSSSTTPEKDVMQRDGNPLPKDFTMTLKSETLAPPSTEHLVNLRAEILRSPPIRRLPSSMPSDVMMSQQDYNNPMDHNNPTDHNNTIEHNNSINHNNTIDFNNRLGIEQTTTIGKRKGKTIFTYKQREVLEKEFAEGNHYLTKNKKIELSKQLKVEEKCVKVWFQNRRVKEKRQREKEFLQSTQNSKIESFPTTYHNVSQNSNTLVSYENIKSDNLSNL